MNKLSRKRMWWRRKSISWRSKSTTKAMKSITYKTILKKWKNSFSQPPPNSKLKETTSTRETSRLMNFLRIEKNSKMKSMISREIKNIFSKKYLNSNSCSTQKSKWNKNICLYLKKKSLKIRNSRLLLITSWSKRREPLSRSSKNLRTSSTSKATLLKWKGNEICSRKKIKRTRN